MGEDKKNERSREVETGVYDREYPDEAFLDALEPDDFRTTNNVSDRVDCAYETAYRRLNILADDGIVEQDRFGSSYVWRLSR